MIHTKYYKSKNVFNTKLSNILNYMVLCVKSNLKNIMSIMNSKCNSGFKGQPFYQLHKNYLEFLSASESGSSLFS